MRALLCLDLTSGTVAFDTLHIERFTCTITKAE
jgi:hypothetical protein